MVFIRLETAANVNKDGNRWFSALGNTIYWLQNLDVMKALLAKIEATVLNLAAQI